MDKRIMEAAKKDILHPKKEETYNQEYSVP